MSATVETGLCRCGCGALTKIARWSNATRGYVGGQPLPYIRGHNRLVGGTDLAERLWSRVRKTASCWLWTGKVEASGYGRLQVAGTRRRVLVHRLAYELLVGRIPAGLTIDHLCMERTCVNPAHMEVVTRAENTARMWRAKKARAEEPVDAEIVADEPLIGGDQ